MTLVFARRRRARAIPGLDHRARPRARAPCDALVYDVLVAPELVDEARRTRSLIAREELAPGRDQRAARRLGRRGLDVVRLKGGDPFIFGRGGEEARRSSRPGSRSRSCPASRRSPRCRRSAGIPVTHRGVSAQVTLVTGTSGDGDDLDYAQLAATPGTLVVFMGLARLEEIADGLIAAGPPSTRRPR